MPSGVVNPDGGSILHLSWRRCPHGLTFNSIAYLTDYSYYFVSRTGVEPALRGLLTSRSDRLSHRDSVNIVVNHSGLILRLNPIAKPATIFAFGCCFTPHTLWKSDKLLNINTTMSKIYFFETDFQYLQTVYEREDGGYETLNIAAFVAISIASSRLDLRLLDALQASISVRLKKFRLESSGL